MQRAAPSRYLGLLYSDYPNINGPTVNAMAKRFVISNDIKQQLAKQIEEDMESLFQSRTINWRPPDRDKARQVMNAFIERRVNEDFDNIRLE